MEMIKNMLRKLTENKAGNIDMILTAVIAGVMFVIAIPIIFSVLGGIDYIALDDDLNGSTGGQMPASNASRNLLTNLETFFTIGPIYIVVVAAVGIIGAILLLRSR